MAKISSSHDEKIGSIPLGTTMDYHYRCPDPVRHMTFIWDVEAKYSADMESCQIREMQKSIIRSCLNHDEQKAAEKFALEEWLRVRSSYQQPRQESVLVRAIKSLKFLHGP